MMPDYSFNSLFQLWLNLFFVGLLPSADAISVKEEPPAIMIITKASSSAVQVVGFAFLCSGSAALTESSEGGLLLG